MRILLLSLMLIIAMTSRDALAADKNKVLSQIEGARATVENFAAKAGDNRAASAELEQARNQVKRASEIYEKAQSLFGFGSIKPEVEQEITHYLALSDLSLTIAASKIESSKATLELDTLEKSLAAVKSKIKVFEDRKIEIEKLKADAARCQTAAKEVETLKAENARLTAEAVKLKGELKAFADQMDELKKQAPPKPEPKPPVDPPKSEPKPPVDPPKDNQEKPVELPATPPSGSK